MSFSYNAQGQVVRRKDQAGTVHEYVFDDAGRRLHDRVTAFGTGIDDAVRRISTAYDVLGRVSTVTQFDTATVNNPDTTGITDQVLLEYDDWGPVSKVRQDHNSAVDASGSVDDYEVSYTYVKLNAGRRGIARSTVQLPDGRALSYQYVGAGDALDSAAGRVSAVWLGQGLNLVEIASYEYTGLARVTRTELPQPDLYRTLVDGDPVEYPGLDRFNRLLTDSWRRELTGGDIDLYKVEYAYGGSLGEFLRIVSAQDVLLKTVDTTPKGVFDWAWGYDGLFRLTEGRRGHLSGGAVSNPDLQEERSWGLDQAGNFDLMTWDLDGDGQYSSGEFADRRTHNVANELTARDIDDDSTNDYTLTYDAAGNLGNDGKDYKYVWDAWNRLVAVLRRGAGPARGREAISAP